MKKDGARYVEKVKARVKKFRADQNPDTDEPVEVVEIEFDKNDIISRKEVQ